MLGLGSSIVTQGFVEGAASPPAPLLLNTYSGASAAYSLRLLDNSYTGSAIRVRRADNNAEQDIGFVSNELDTTALATFCSGTNGFVKTWYDQAGANDATQTTTGNQPKIYDSSTGVVTENGKPAMQFDGSNDQFNMNAVSTTSAFTLARSTSFNFANRFLGGTIAIDYPGQDGTFGNISAIDGTNALRIPSSRVDNTRYLLSVLGIGASGAIYRNGSLGVSGTLNSMSFNEIGDRSATANINFAGTAQEIVLYGTDQSSNRTGIEANINTEYAIYGQSPTGLLADYPGAAAAYSLRQLISTANYAVAVRRDSDDAVLPIGFVNGELDTTTLADFCSGTDGFVVIWFDQSGEGNHATQTTPGNQPKIYDSVAGVVTENEKPAVEFDGVDNWMSASGFGEGAERSVFNTMKAVSDPASGYSNYWIFLQTAPSTTGNFLQLYSSSYDDSLVANFQTAGLDITTSQGLQDQSLVSVIKGSSSSNLYKDGTSIGSGSGAQAMEDELSIGRFSTNYAVQKQQELVIYNSDQSSNRTGIETNINDFYSIYQ